VVVHLAADPTAQQTWPNIIGPNVDAVVNVFQACVQHGVQRIVYASSNHVMGGYKDVTDPWQLTTTLPPWPGARYVVAGEQRDSTPYASAKLFGERLGHALSTATTLSVLAIRLGWVQKGDNRPQDISPDRDPWFRLMWLSNRDYLQLMEKCLVADPRIRFAVLNAMSANTGMRWDLSEICRILGYAPQDDVTA
jgi:uronate dehydrogenase